MDGGDRATHGFDFGEGGVCGGAAVFVDVGESEFDLGGEVGAAHDFPDVGEKFVVAVPAEFALGAAVFSDVGDGGGGDGDGAFDGRGVEAGVEWKQAQAVGAGAFGEEQDGDGATQALGDLFGGGFGAGAAGAVDKEGAAGSGQGAEEWPAADLNLGDEVDGQGCREDEDVEIAEVIGDEESTLRARAFDGEADVEQAHDKDAGFVLPQGAALHGVWACEAHEQGACEAVEECEPERHSAPDRAKIHCVSGARKRLRAEAESCLRSSRVRKSMVPKSRSQAGGAAMRAPMAM